MSTVTTTTRLVGRDFLTDQDFVPGELIELLDLAEALKALAAEGVATPLLAGAHLGLILEEPSTRTRVSFEVAMRELGGDAVILEPGETHLGRRESVGDTARVLSRYVHAIGARLRRHDDLVALAAAASVPVVNGLTDVDHPVQTMADALTIRERFGRLEGVRVTFLGAAGNVCNSLAVTGTRLGMRVTVANPSAYRMDDAVAARSVANAAATGGAFVWTDNPVAAVAEADVVYTDLWWQIGQEHEAGERTLALRPFQVNRELMGQAPAHAVLMHSLPATRGREVTADVLDSDRSIVFDQAENRLHFEKALLAALIGVSPAASFDDDRVRALAAGIGARR